MKIAILTTDNRGPFGQYDKPAPWFGMAPEALLAGLAALPDLEIHVVSCIRQAVHSPAKLSDNVWFHSLHVPKIGWMRTGYAGCVRVVRRRLQIIQPDLVHGQGTEFEAAICAVRSGFPNVITLLGIMKEMVQVTNAKPGSFVWLAALLESYCMKRTAGVLANSRFTQEKIRSRTRKTWLVHNAIREVFFDTPKTETDAADVPTLLNVGTVCAYKRQNELLAVAEQLHADGLHFHLKFIGQAAQGNIYAEKFLERIKRLAFVSHHQFMPTAELIAQYDRATALVHVSAVESFGLVVAEALARNLKFIGFNSGGVADIVAGIEGSEAFSDLDWIGLKNALAHWIKARAPRPANAATVIRERFHPARIARQHLDVYREVLADLPKTRIA